MSEYGLTARARMVSVQIEVNRLFTEIQNSGVTGRNVAEALVATREVLKSIDFALSRLGRI